ncbi:MAG TPA: rhodanese-like domain-containing protein, partial [Candidatus Binataceae bacterium]|nr:rhodanese-like domain-containing protein [Candidatus Binataceae bacterium]
MAETIDAIRLQGLMHSDAPFALIDVREWGEFSLGQILGARNIARGSLEKYLPFLVPDRAVTLVLMCDDGRRAALAAKTAEQLGYTRVTVSAGGLEGWKLAGGETYGGWSLTGKDYGERLLVEENVPELIASALHEMLNRGERVTILDSRPYSEFKASHLPGAHSAPIGDLALVAADFASDPSVPIVTNCAGRTRSIIAAHLLLRMKLPNPVYALKGGTGAWRIAGWGDELARGEDPAKQQPSSASLSAAGYFARRLRSEDQIAVITPDALHARLASGELVYVLDVRSGEEYVAGHILGARFCSATQVQFAADALVGVPNAQVVVMSDDDARSTAAGSILKGMGYLKTAVLDGGYPAWSARGFETETGAPFEIDYGQPMWLARFLQDFPPVLGKQRQLPVSGIDRVRERVKFISANVLQEKAAKPLVIIDLRGAGEFASGHIPGARWLSRGRLELDLAEVAHPDTRLVLYSRDETRSVLAAATLSELGYTDVTVLQGGFENWKRSGRPTDDGLGAQPELEEIAAAEIGLFGTGKFGYSN